MINTDLIPENFKFYSVNNWKPQLHDDIGFDKTQFISLVNRWKYLFRVKYGCKRGDIAAIAVMGMTCNHVAIIFALAELGATAIILDVPVSTKTMHKTKAALYAPLAFAIEDAGLRDLFGTIHHEMLKKYCNVIIDEKEIDSVTEELTERFNEPSDILITSSTSGSTGTPKKILFTQEEVYKISKRNIDVFKFDENSRVAHTKNMHHASSLLTHSLPALMVSDNHWAGPMINMPKDLTPEILLGLRRNKINRILLQNSFVIENFINSAKATGGKFEKTFLINVSGYVVPEIYVETCKELNVEFISHFGQINGAIPLLINHVTVDSPWIKGNLGVLPDDFYKVRDIQGHLSVACELWPEERLVDDKLEAIMFNGCDIYMHKGTKTEMTSYELILQKSTTDYALFTDPMTSKFVVVFWEQDQQLPPELLPLTHSVHHLDKMTFTTETKVNMEQLGAYIDVR